METRELAGEILSENVGRETVKTLEAIGKGETLFAVTNIAICACIVGIMVVTIHTTPAFSQVIRVANRTSFRTGSATCWCESETLETKLALEVISSTGGVGYYF